MSEFVRTKIIAVVFFSIFGCPMTAGHSRVAAAEGEFPAEWYFDSMQGMRDKLEGRPAPEISTDKWIGDETTLEDCRGKVVVLDFWATWCGPCVSELPEFVDINRMYRKRHFETITISLDEPDAKDNALKLLKESYASTTNFLSSIEDTDEFAEAFDSKWPGPVPYTILVAPGGEIVFRVEGEINVQELRREIADRLGRTYASRK